MKVRHLLIVLGLVVGLAAVPDARAAKGVKKKGEHWVHGTVVQVEHKGRDHGEVTVKVHHAKKKNAAAGRPAHLHHFSVTHHTHVLVARAGGEQHVPFADVRKGEHVAVLARDHHAEKVVIHPHHPKRVVKK
jgi:hypothetical protein